MSGPEALGPQRNAPPRCLSTHGAVVSTECGPDSYILVSWLQTTAPATAHYSPHPYADELSMTRQLPFKPMLS